MGNILSSTAGLACTLFDILHFVVAQPLFSLPSAGAGAYAGYVYIDKTLLVVGLTATGGLVLGYMVFANKDPNCDDGLVGLIMSLGQQAFGLAKELFGAVGGGVAGLFNSIIPKETASAESAACNESITAAGKAGKVTSDQAGMMRLANALGSNVGGYTSCRKDVKSQESAARAQASAAADAATYALLHDAEKSGWDAIANSTGGGQAVYSGGTWVAPPSADQVDAEITSIMAFGKGFNFQPAAGTGGRVVNNACASWAVTLLKAEKAKAAHLPAFQLFYAQKCMGYKGTAADFNPNILPQATQLPS